MLAKFWGVRGSIAVPGPDTVKYGGNTPCIEVRGAKGECLVLDAGTGIRVLGLDLMKRGMPLPPINIFITHTHWDHIQGFPFFVPNYIPGTAITVKGPVHFLENKSLQDIFDNQMNYDYFPISNKQLAAGITFESLGETTLTVGSLTIKTLFTNHPIRSLGYRLEENGRSLFYTGDHEPYYNLFENAASAEEPDDDILFGDVGTTVDDANQRFIDFFRKVNVLVVDCQYTPDEYIKDKRSWGHSSWDHCLRWMQDAEVERMVLTHHDPLRTDENLDGMLQSVHLSAREMGLDPQNITIAYEGLEIPV